MAVLRMGQKAHFGPFTFKIMGFWFQYFSKIQFLSKTSFSLFLVFSLIDERESCRISLIKKESLS
jgi:hypothetical protein